MSKLDRLYKIEDIFTDIADIASTSSDLHKTAKEIAFTLQQVRMESLSYNRATKKVEKLLQLSQACLFTPNERAQESSIEAWHALKLTHALLAYFFDDELQTEKR